MISHSSNSTAVSQESASLTQARAPRRAAWYRPTISPEHGIYVVLFGSFLTGVAAAQQWTLPTTLALICAFAGFQAEHPLTLQLKQRRSWKPRFLIWGGLYAGTAFGLAGYLYLQTPGVLGLCLIAIATLIVDAVAVWYRQQKSVLNELLTFAAVCLAAPLAYRVTSGALTLPVIGLWLLNTLFFSSAIFTVKLRKPKTNVRLPGLVYHSLASLAIGGLWYCGWLTPITASAFGVALLKYGFILGRQTWYRTTAMRHVILLETLSALVFLAIIVLSLLPGYAMT